MKPFFIFLPLFFAFFFATPGFGQSGCEFNITGVWQSSLPGDGASVSFDFGADGTVTMALRGAKTARATYKLDDPASPKEITFGSTSEGGAFPWAGSRLEISRHDDVSFAAVSAEGPITWKRKSPNRYFVILAARHGSPGAGGPAVGMLIRSEGNHPLIETFGLYYDGTQRITGPVPAESYKHFMTGPGTDSEAILRLEITPAEFDRGMKIMRTWQRRARESELLFPQRSYLNSIVPLKEIAESLNQCSEKIKLHKLNWAVDDEIGANYGLSEVSFQYVKKLRELNDALHLQDNIFRQSVAGRRERKPSQP
jgi:hypothetical protein